MKNTITKRNIYRCLFIFCMLPLWSVFAKEDSFVIYFNNYLLFFENADFQHYRKENFRNNQAVSAQNSDDAYRMAYGELRLLVEKQYKNSTLYIDMARAAHWGADNFQGRDKGQNAVYFRRLYFVQAFSPDLYLSLGRQKYEIGNAYQDYFFSDTLDGFSLTYSPFSDIFSINFMGDLLSNSVRNEETGRYGIVSKDEEGIDDFRGDTVTARAGFNLKLETAESPSSTLSSLGLRAFSYHLRYGASSQGAADLAENGKNPYNKSDGDFLAMSGLRFYSSFFAKSLSFDLTGAYAQGQDLQFASRHIYNDSAWALNLVWKAGAYPALQNELSLSAGYFRPYFASMKGTSMGAMLLGGYKGYHPAPHTAPYHFRDYAKQQDAPLFIDRTNPKSFLKLKERLKLGALGSSLSLLGLWETRSSEYMGSEVELSLEYRIDNIKFSKQSALFFPSSYYQRRSLANKFIPAGRDVFYGLRLGLEYVLDLDHITIKKSSKKRQPERNKAEELFNKTRYSDDD